jgi:methyltransferase
MTPAAWLLALVSLERVAELALARRNTRWLQQRGAVEHASGHYPVIVLLHAAWLAGLWLLGRNNPVNTVLLAAFLLLQALRVWVLATLGSRWTTRIIVQPGAPLVARGPYRWLAHPNYVVVVGEIAVLPLCLGLPGFALAFSAANAAVLAIRIRAEDAALHGSRRTAASGRERS